MPNGELREARSRARLNRQHQIRNDRRLGECRFCGWQTARHASHAVRASMSIAAGVLRNIVVIGSVMSVRATALRFAFCPGAVHTLAITVFMAGDETAAIRVGGADREAQQDDRKLAHATRKSTWSLPCLSIHEVLEASWAEVRIERAGSLGNERIKKVAWTSRHATPPREGGSLHKRYDMCGSKVR